MHFYAIGNHQTRTEQELLDVLDKHSHRSKVVILFTFKYFVKRQVEQKESILIILQLYVTNVTWAHILNIIYNMYDLEYQKNLSTQVHFFLNSTNKISVQL